MTDLSLLAEPFEAADIEWRAGVTNADKTGTWRWPTSPAGR